MTGLWLGLAVLRLLAALPVRQPRIFRDELLHWQLAHTFITHRPFLVAGEAVDYPAVLYPALLSLGLHTANAHLAFQLAHALNALMVSAVVLFAYALAREVAGHREALGAALLAGLAPGGAYSVFIMEENLYYPLFVASCWLGWRVLVSGRVRDALWCALALGLTYFAKPLTVPLVATYAAVVVLWAAVELPATERDARRRLAAIVVRLLPVATFGAMLVVRHALTARGVADSQAGVVLGRFYTEELGGALVPPVLPMVRVIASLTVALTFAVGIAPAVAMLGGWRERVAERRVFWLAILALALAATYVFAAARHTLLLNPVPKIHERYVFAVGPLFLALYAASKEQLPRRVSIAVACTALFAILIRIPDTTLVGSTWVNAPSLTLGWLIRTKVSSVVVPALLAVAVAAVVCLLARARVPGRGALPVATLAGVLVALNAAWYAFVYHIQSDRVPLEQTLARLEALAPADARITAVVTVAADPMALLSHYGKFWLGDRFTAYWTGAGRAPWYVEMSGPDTDVVARTRPAYLVGLPGVDALCPRGAVVPSASPADGLAVQVVAAPPDGCGPPSR